MAGKIKMLKEKMSAKGGSAFGGETKENFSQCCGGLRKKHKKGFVIGAIAILLIAVAVVSILGALWRRHEMRNFGYGQQASGRSMMGRGKIGYQTQNNQNNDDQFVTALDASKSGEIAIVVSDLGSAQKAVSDVAAKNGGSVYATHISYATDNFKNGSIVVQVPQENFDATFGDLKKIGTKVIQESTQQIEPRNVYPVMTPMSAQSGSATDQSAPVETGSAVQPSIAIAPNYIPQQAQDKGYIKIIFADYGTNQNIAPAGNIFSAGDQDFSNKLILVLILKTSLLLILFVFLVIILKRNFRNFREIKKSKTKNIPVRQVKLQVKTRPRAVKAQRRKL